MKEIGKVTQYFAKIGVGAIELTEGALRVGDTIFIQGHTTDFQQTIDSLQVDNQPVQEAHPGQVVGIKLKDRVRPHDTVYLVIP